MSLHTLCCVEQPPADRWESTRTVLSPCVLALDPVRSLQPVPLTLNWNFPRINEALFPQLHHQPWRGDVFAVRLLLAARRVHGGGVGG